MEVGLGSGSGLMRCRHSHDPSFKAEYLLTVTEQNSSVHTQTYHSFPLKLFFLITLPQSCSSFFHLRGRALAL